MTGAIEVHLSYDAFGQRRGASWTGAPSGSDWATIKATTQRGYTDHEQLDNLNLIHMNGRVHDPAIGRFLSGYPYVPDPYNGQSFNRYSYVNNSPLSFTDPSGFDSESFDLRLCDGDCFFPATFVDPHDHLQNRDYTVVPRSTECPGSCHSGGIEAPAVITPEMRAYTTRFYQNLLEDLSGPVFAPYHLATGQYYFSGDEASRGWAAVAMAPYVGVVGRQGGNVAKAIPWSSRRVHDAAEALESGATDVRVASRSQAEELFFGRYQGTGYRNTTGMSPREVKDFYGGKAGTYHWDTGTAAYPHGSSHLQIHTHEGDVVRIFFGD